MSATFKFSETNGAGTTVTDDIANLNFGSNDSVEVVPATYPIIAGENSYEKFLQANFSGTFTEISNMKFWMSGGTFGVGEGIDADVDVAYSQPVVSTSTVATTAMPNAEGSAFDVLAADGTAVTIVAEGYTGYICLQLQTTGSTPSGAVDQKEFTFQYDEV